MGMHRRGVRHALVNLTAWVNRGASVRVENPAEETPL